MQTSIKVKGLKPRVDVFTKKLHTNMTRLWNDATKAFVVEVIKHIHIDTGMSRMSIAPLGRAVRMLTVVKAFNSRNPGMGGPLRGPWPSRNQDLGEKLGQKPAFKLNFGSPARPVFYFEFDIKVFQYALHESEWQSLDKGREAFLDYLNTNAIRYVPRLAEWILPETK